MLAYSLILITLSTLPIYPLSYSTATDTTDSDFGAGLVKSSVTIVGTGDAAYVEISTGVRNDGVMANWKYRRAININNSLTYGLSDYQVWIPTTAFGSAWTDIKSKAKSNMDDFRFTPSTATTTIPYWIEDNTTTPKGFWVKVSTLVAGANTIYMYYGNPSAGVGQSGNATFEFFDDFESGTGKWINISAPTWGIVNYNGNNVLEIRGDSTGSWDEVKSTSTFTLTSFVIDFRTMHPDATMNASESNHICVSNVDATPVPEFQIRYYADTLTYWYGNGTQDGEPAFDSTYNIWYLQSLLMNGTGVRCFINRVQYINITDNNIPSTKAVRFGVYGNGLTPYSHSYFDDVRLRKYAPTEPTIASVGSEEGPYFPAGEFQSRIIDSGKSASKWFSIFWSSVTPEGTSIKLKTRTGETSTPDGSWSDWYPQGNSYYTASTGTPVISPDGRYIQYLSSFTTTVSTSTPQLLDVSITYCQLPDAPTINRAKSLSENSIEWGWSDNSTQEEGFKIYSSTGGLISSVGQNVTYYIETGLSRNKTYSRYLQSYNAAGSSSSATVSWRTRPGTYQSKTSYGEPARTGQNSFGFVGDGFWEWQIPVKSGLPLTITAYIRYNTEYGGSATKPKITLYGKGISPTSVSATSAAQNAWELLTINAGTPSENAMLKLKAEGFSTNPGAKFYIDDIKVNQ